MTKFTRRLSAILFHSVLTLFSITFFGELNFFDNNKLWADFNSLNYSVLPTNVTPVLPKETHLRTQYLLNYLKAQSLIKEYPVENLLKKIPAQSQTKKGFEKLLPYFDLHQVFPKIAQVSDAGMSIYYDPISKTDLNFETSFSSVSTPIDNNWFREFRERQLLATSEAPLMGIRVALDPGHMGGKLWDTRTGKYVKDDRGRVLSEGILALQTALLLEKELTSLGAEVLITHRSTTPVTSVPYESLDIQEFAKRELQTQIQSSWFLNIINRIPAGPSLVSALQTAPEYKRLFQEVSRWTYFFQREDLDARANLINEFQPHLTLIIHYDTAGLPGNEHGLNPSLVNKTKAYVPGAFMESELATSEDRVHFVYHLMNPTLWDGSVRLSEELVRELSQKLSIGYDPTGGSRNVKKVSEGVFTRNLGLTRRIVGHPISYLECMFYNTPSEFEKLYRNDFTVDIDGTPTPASNRILVVVDALKQGILNFVKNYQPSE